MCVVLHSPGRSGGEGRDEIRSERAAACVGKKQNVAVLQQGQALDVPLVGRRGEEDSKFKFDFEFDF
jgi:hypothetical protein